MCWVRGPSCNTGRIAGARINGQPQPLHLGMAAQPRSQFVQLQVREPQMAEKALVQVLSVLACARQPGGDRGWSKALRRGRPQKGPALREAAESTTETR